MLASMLHALPVLAADKSKVPFFIAGGVLAVGRLRVDGDRDAPRADFPRSAGGRRVIAISALLVVGAMSTAITAGVPAKTTTGTPASSSAPAPAPAPAPASKARSRARRWRSPADPTGQLKFDKSVVTVAAAWR